MTDLPGGLGKAHGTSERYIPQRLSTVLFDLDDTLLNCFATRASALQSVFTDVGIHGISGEDFMRDTRGGQLLELLYDLERRQGQELNLLDRYRSAYWTQSPGLISLYPGVKHMLQKLHGHGVKLGIVTQKVRAFELNGRLAGASRELEEVGVAGLFSVVVGFEDVSNYKPHPEGVELALKRLGAGLRETLMVGDSTADIGAAKAAGCWSCHATWGRSVVGDPQGDLGADMVAETPEALSGLSFLDSR